MGVHTFVDDRHAVNSMVGDQQRGESSDNVNDMRRLIAFRGMLSKSWMNWDHRSRLVFGFDRHRHREVGH